LDVHRDFCVVAICEDGQTRTGARVPSTPKGLAVLAQSLLPSDRVALEVTGSCWEVARILEPHVERVVVVSPDDTGIAQARAKTDPLDAHALARLLWSGSLSRCGCPMNAAACCVAGWRGASSSCAHGRGRRTRSRRVERLIAQQALNWPEIRRLMTVPGVNLIGAATFIAAIGHANRFLTSRKLVAYLGLDPKVRQSGEAPARSGKISKRGSAAARWALVEAAWSVVGQPGPLHAFYDRTRARRGHGKAIVATARKLAILFWCMLTRDEDYAHQQPSLTRKKLRRLEITAAAPARKGKPSGVWVTTRGCGKPKRQLAAQAEASYKRLVTDRQAAAPTRKVGASVTAERA
jgi:hypothetical protein